MKACVVKGYVFAVVFILAACFSETAAARLVGLPVVSLRPRRSSLSVFEFCGKSVDPREVQFSLVDNGKTAGVYLFIPDFRESDVDLKQIGYLLLDDLLGEYDVEARVGLIKMLSPDTRTGGDRYPLNQLPILFDQLVCQLEGRSGRPS